MDKDQPALTPPWADLDALIDFVEELRRAGYRVGVKEYLDVHQVLLTVAAAGTSHAPGDGHDDGGHDDGGLDALLRDDPDAVRRLIGPILCSTPAEQREFASRFADWVERRRAAAQAPAAASHPSLAEELKEISRKDRLRWLPSLGVYLALLLFALLVVAIFGPGGISRTWSPTPTSPIAPTIETSVVPLTSSHIPEITETRTPAPPSQGFGLPDVSIVILRPVSWPAVGIAAGSVVVVAAVLAIAGLLVGRRLWYQYRARLFLERRGSQEPPDITRLRVGSSGRDLFDTPATRTAIRRLRRRIPAQARTVDVERTLAHFMRNGGWLSPVYASRQELPEYIVLVSRTSYPDHLANLVDELLAVLHSGSVYLSIYYFDATPELCAAGAQRGRAVTLPELAAGAAGQRLLIFGEAQVMLDPLGGEPAAWTRLLKAWPVHALFTPNPPGDWNAAEQQAARVVAVWPALPEGLDLFIRTVHGEEGTDYLTDRTRAAALPSELRARPIRWLEPDAPPAADVQRVLTGVRGYLGDWGYTWLCACAIYPEVRWNLTLFLGAYLAASYTAPPGASANAGDTGIGSPGSVQSPYFQRTLLDLVRLPWFRYGTIPDWLRRVLIAGLAREQEAAVRTALQGLLLTSLDNPGSGFQLEIAHAYQKTMRHLVKPLLDLLRRNAPPHSPLNDRVFLAFMSGHNRTQLAVRLPEALAAAWRRQERVPRPALAPEDLAAGAPGSAAGTLPAPFPDTRLGGGAMSGAYPPPALSRWENVRALLASRTTWLLIGVGALVLGITSVVFYALSSYLLLLPADKFNIAVADIGIVDPGGSVRDGPESGVLAGAIAVTLRSLANDSGDTLPATADPVMVWTDSLSEPQKMVPFGIVAGATADDRSAAAANLAERVNADVVIYGVYSRGDTTSDAQGELVLRVYPAPQLADPELAYAFNLLTLHLPLPPAAVQDGNATQPELVAALRPQLTAILLMLAGRLQSLDGDSDAALGLYGQAQAALAQSGAAAAGENDGIWQLVGREAHRSRRWNTAINTLKHSLDLNPNNPFARLQLARAYAERAYYGAAALARMPDGLAQCSAPAWAHAGGSMAAVKNDLVLAEQTLFAADRAAGVAPDWVDHEAVVQLLSARIALAKALLAGIDGAQTDRDTALDGADSAIGAATDALAEGAATDLLGEQAATARATLRLEAQFLSGLVLLLQAQSETQTATSLDQARAAFAHCNEMADKTRDRWAVQAFANCGCSLYAAWTTPTPVVAQNLTFANGRAVASGQVAAGEKAYYSFFGVPSQSLTVTVTAASTLLISVMGQDRTQVISPTQAVPASAVMPTPQIYFVVVEGAPNAPATVYDLVVTLSSAIGASLPAVSTSPTPITPSAVVTPTPQMLNFVNGTATVQGVIAANQPQDYLYFGGAGQTVLISLMNPALGELTGARFAVTGANNVVYKSLEDPLLSWFFTMPVSQNYRITIISPQTAVYTLEVAFPPDSIQQDASASQPQSATQSATPVPAPLSQADAPPIPGCTTTALQNGGFESDGAWSFGGSDMAMPGYVSTPVQADLRALRLGLDPALGSAVQKASSLSSVRQPIQIPADAAVAQLRWSHFYRTDEESSGALGPDSDRQEVLLLNPDLSTVAVLQSVRRNDDAWVTDTFDLTPYKGQSLILAFNVYNDGNGRSTWQYLDEVSLAVCTSSPSSQTAP